MDPIPLHVQLTFARVQYETLLSSAPAHKGVNLVQRLCMLDQRIRALELLQIKARPKRPKHPKQ